MPLILSLFSINGAGPDGLHNLIKFSLPFVGPCRQANSERALWRLARASTFQFARRGRIGDDQVGGGGQCHDAVQAQGTPVLWGH